MKFISFGCWNKGDPDDKNYPLYHLIESLRNRLSKRDIDFVMITGDNYYYHNDKEKSEDYPFTESMKLENIHIPLEGGAEKKDKKVKKDKDSCDLFLLEKTFNRINETGEMYDVPIYMCSGNHEYKLHTILNKHLLTVEISPPTDTVKDPGEDKENLLDYQKQLLKDGDTNYMEQGELSYEGPLFYTINTEKGRLNMSFIKAGAGEHIYIFGHIPILSLNPKPRKGRIWDINGYLVDAFDKLKPNNITYICADTHNYQDIEIIFQNGKKVRQFVIGSGGTFKMDDLMEDKATIVDDPKLKEFSSKIKSINLNEAVTGHHGFCVFDTTDISASPEFISFFPLDTLSPEPEPDLELNKGFFHKRKSSKKKKSKKRKKTKQRKRKRKSKRK